MFKRLQKKINSDSKGFFYCQIDVDCFMTYGKTAVCYTADVTAGIKECAMTCSSPDSCVLNGNPACASGKFMYSLYTPCLFYFFSFALTESISYSSVNHNSYGICLYCKLRWF